MTGMTLTEYVRRRRLTLAAQDLQHSKTPIIDIAMKYGYDSATAFSRAFAKQHGITPSVYRKDGGSLKVYPPASFHIMIKGAKEMDFRIIELEDTEVYGVSKQYEGMATKLAKNCAILCGQITAMTFPVSSVRADGISRAVHPMMVCGTEYGRMANI